MKTVEEILVRFRFKIKNPNGDGILKVVDLEDAIGIVKSYCEQLIEQQSNWLMVNTSLDVEKIVDFKEKFKKEIAED